MKLILWLSNPEDIDRPDCLSFAVADPKMEMELQGWVRIREVDFTLPGKQELIPTVVTKLREQQRQIRERAESACQGVEHVLQSFLALEAPKEL